MKAPEKQQRSCVFRDERQGIKCERRDLSPGPYNKIENVSKAFIYTQNCASTEKSRHIRNNGCAIFIGSMTTSLQVMAGHGVYHFDLVIEPPES